MSTSATAPEPRVGYSRQRYVEFEERTGYTMHQSRVPLHVLCGGAP